MQFTTINKPFFQFAHLHKQISFVSNTKFLHIHINDTINWKNHIEYILPKLSTASHATRIIKPYMFLETLKIVYRSTFKSVISYGSLFWGISPHSKNIF